MAKIIDLDFYRKFKIVLPLRPRSAASKKAPKASRPLSKSFRRRRKEDLSK